MDNNSGQSRRKFFRNAGLLGMASVLAPPFKSLKAAAHSTTLKPVARFEIGVASWALREYSFEELIPALKILQLKNISLKSMHLPLDLPPDELKDRIVRLRGEGLNPYAPGVVYMESEEAVEKAFEYTRAADLGMIVGVPNYDLLDMVEKKVKETGIRMAIHNHGPDNRPYPGPEEAIKRINGRDPGMGVCIDLAHTLRAGLDPVIQLHLAKDRLFDIHIWDVSEAAKSGKAVRPGTGIMNFKAILKTLIDIDYSGTIAIEYGSEKENPIPAFAETKGYINGVLSIL